MNFANRIHIRVSTPDPTPCSAKFTLMTFLLKWITTLTKPMTALTKPMALLAQPVVAALIG